MKITKLETFLVPPRWLFLKMETDEGVTGWGEPVVEGKAATVAAAVEEMSDYLVGKDPANIEDHWQVLYRGGFYRGGPILMSAIAGVDQALWDIKGKTLGVPVHQLLGGKCRDRVRVYSWVGGDKPSDVGQAALAASKAGFTAIKMNGTDALQIVDGFRQIDDAVARIAEIRQCVGNDFGIGVDFHGRVHLPMARTLIKALEPYRPMFFEEPLLPDQMDGLREIVRHTHIPIALGERLYSTRDFRKVFAEGLAAIVQPDPSHAGGITECRKIAAMAEAHDIAVAFHCPLGPIALAACLQIDAVAYNAFIQEQSMGIHYNEKADILDYIKNPRIFRYRDGFVDIPAGPGLGVEVNEERVREAAKAGHRWRNPVWRHEDGSVAEW